MMPRRLLLVAALALGACRYDPTPTGPTTVTQTTTVTTTYPPPPVAPVPTPTPTPGGSSSSPRTPDPVTGGTLPLPTYGPSVLQSYAASAAGAAALANACPGTPTSWAFLDGLVDQLRQKDARWGYLCKRGNCFDPSADVIAYHATSGPDITGTAGVIGVDVIGDLCGSNAAQWSPLAFDPAGLWSSRGRF
jgi:hypothetical protein